MDGADLNSSKLWLEFTLRAYGFCYEFPNQSLFIHENGPRIHPLRLGFQFLFATKTGSRVPR
jgi:hypothetical protein